MSAGFWAGKRVFVTGHTGFIGSWLSLSLHELGAEIAGYALAPPTDPSLFALANVAATMTSHTGDVRDAEALARAVGDFQPDIVLHLAAQPLVRRSYDAPAETYSTNVMGTVHLCEAVRATESVAALVVFTSDKCYENREWDWPYRENDRLGGADPYSSSKACTELVCDAYRRSFFSDATARGRSVAVASVRAGNVLGGGDWAEDRLVPDFVRARMAGVALRLRNPDAVRPWQHVLEPIGGMLEVARRLCEQGASAHEAWNFGPAPDDAMPVREVVDRLAQAWGQDTGWTDDDGDHPHEAKQLRLDCAKARALLGWRPRWPLARALAETARWYQAWLDGADLRALTLEQIRAYVGDTEEQHA